MNKRALLLSSLMFSLPVVTLAQPADTAPSAGAAVAVPAVSARLADATPAAGTVVAAPGAARATNTVAGMTAGTKQEAAGNEHTGLVGVDVVFHDPKPNTGNPEKDALIVERHQRQRLVYHLQARLDSEINRMALGRLAASRGGDPDFSEKKNQAMLQEIRDRRNNYERQIIEAQAALKETEAKLAALDERLLAEGKRNK